jgi:hypothetical protein
VSSHGLFSLKYINNTLASFFYIIENSARPVIKYKPLKYPCKQFIL